MHRRRAGAKRTKHNGRAICTTARPFLPTRARNPKGAERVRMLISALRVLEAATGASLAVLLTLDLAVIAREVTGTLQRAATLRIFRRERAGDAVTHGIRLGAVAA